MLNAAAGFDLLIGGLGKDKQIGGADADRFDFNALAESSVGGNRDQILDFVSAQGDKIDLSTIDASSHAPGNNAFKFIGAHAFTHHDAELRFAGHILQGDVNGDGKADFEIFVSAASLLNGDFVL
jgi:Ca2+-binding RTX toxin-like protein